MVWSTPTTLYISNITRYSYLFFNEITPASCAWATKNSYLPA